MENKPIDCRVRRTRDQIQKAFICGTPVIALDISGVTDHINSERGMVFHAGDCAALSKIVDDIITDSSVLEGMGVNALRYGQAVFPWSAVMRRVVDEVYYPVLGNCKRRDDEGYNNNQEMTQCIESVVNTHQSK